ncbi:MAG: class I SAM-dependent methyltransferase [Clostridia bacterium]|nr:class I SAM-dependent methyltransferase [Clostridia bacterium]
MYVTRQWRDFEVLDTGDGEKLERWRDILLVRPDPQVIWPKADPALWNTANARYTRSSSGGGRWEHNTPLPERWHVECMGLRFIVRPTGFKHTGLFPEQADNWEYMHKLTGKRASGGQPVRVLNLFGYTGGASLACARAGAQVTHVDAARGMVQWAKENRAASGLPETAFRFIVEDAKAFVGRETRRGNHYEGIIMDPPSYGRGPQGEVWKLEDELFQLVSQCARLLSNDALFFIINGYTTGIQAAVLLTLLDKAVRAQRGGSAEAGEVCLPVSTGGVLPCGNTGRWQSDDA